MAAYEGAQSLFGVTRETLGEKDHRAQSARLSVDREPSSVRVAPDLDGEKAHEETEDHTHRRQHPRRHLRERAASVADGESHDNPVDRCRNTEHGCEHEVVP
jgi:hypothetical protein